MIVGVKSASRRVAPERTGEKTVCGGVSVIVTLTVCDPRCMYTDLYRMYVLTPHSPRSPILYHRWYFAIFRFYFFADYTYPNHYL